MGMLSKSLIGCVITALGISVPSLLVSQDNLPEIVKKVKPSTVVILTYDKEGKALSQGSGFFISREGDVITNRHVIQGAIKAEIKTTEGNTYPIKQVMAEDVEGDIIRLSVDIPTGLAPPLKISSSLLSEGERIIVIGSPLGLEQTISDGIVSAIREIPGYGKVVQITAPISPGSSGSPVVNTKGEVVGIATFLVREGQNLNFAIPQERLAGLVPGDAYDLAEREAKRTSGGLASAKESFSIGIKYLLTKDNEKALACFETSAKDDPEYALAYGFIGYCNGLLGRYQRSVEAFKQAIAIRSDFDMAYGGLGFTYQEMGLFQKAEEAFNSAIHINPKNAYAHNNLGNLYDHLNRTTEAIGAYEQAILLRPGMFEPYANLGGIYIKMKRWTDAVTFYDQAIRLNPKSAPLYVWLGVGYTNLGRHKEAVEAYNQAIRIDPDYAQSHFQLGSDYIKRERYREGVQAFKQVIRLEPDNSEAHFILGLAYQLLGNRKAAKAEYEILKGLNVDLANKLLKVIR